MKLRLLTRTQTEPVEFGSLLKIYICYKLIKNDGFTAYKSRYVYDKQKTTWKVLCTVFIHSLFRIIKLTRSQSLARSFYDTSQLVNKNRTRALSM